jgi:hypothetical protein
VPVRNHVKNIKVLNIYQICYWYLNVKSFFDKKPTFSLFQAGKEKKLSIINDSRASLAHKILIPVVLLVTAGAAAPIYLLDYQMKSHTCTGN